MSTRTLVLPLILTLITLGACASRSRQLCDNIRLEEGRLTLSKNAKLLVCGSGKRGQEGWTDVPIPQAQYQIKVLLQNEGYLNPRFERRDQELIVWSGRRDRIEKLIVHGAEHLLKPSRKRQIIGQPLTPEKLDELKRWADTELQAQGYPCPRVDIKAQAWDHTVIIDVDLNVRRRIGGFDYQGLNGLDTETIARYQATEPGAWYDIRDTQLTSNRMLADGLFQSAYVVDECKPPDTVELHLRASVGRPRIFRFGVGASTEEFPFVRVTFRNARLDDRASSFTSTLYASPRSQSLDAGAEFYRLPFSRRMFWAPRALVARTKERSGEYNRAELGVDLGRYWDAWSTRMQARGGPMINYVDTVEGIGPSRLTYLGWNGRYSVMNHAYELGQREQREGWTGDFGYRGQRQGIGSPINVDRFEFNFKSLWNPTRQAPPLFIVASRLQAIAVNANPAEFNQNSKTLPVDNRVFYGGDQNLRGFPRQSLRNDKFGYLTALYLGIELRLIEQLPYHLEPFLLIDSAQLGIRRMTLDAPVFGSGGFGLRWASPFGTLRGSFARGRIFKGDDETSAYPQTWVAFVSFGQEF